MKKIYLLFSVFVCSINASENNQFLTDNKVTICNNQNSNISLNSFFENPIFNRFSDEEKRQCIKNISTYLNSEDVKERLFFIIKDYYNEYYNKQILNSAARDMFNSLSEDEKIVFQDKIIALYNEYQNNNPCTSLSNN